MLISRYVDNVLLQTISKQLITVNSLFSPKIISFPIFVLKFQIAVDNLQENHFEPFDHNASLVDLLFSNMLHFYFWYFKYILMPTLSYFYWSALLNSGFLLVRAQPHQNPLVWLCPVPLQVKLMSFKVYLSKSMKVLASKCT